MFGKIKTPTNFPSLIFFLVFSSHPNHHKPHEISSQITKTPLILLPLSHSHILLKSPRKPSSVLCNHTNSINNQELTHNCNGLKFVRGKKLLRDLSTWSIGGPCNYFVQVFDQTQLVSALRYCHEHCIRFMIIGKGSNCLFDDLGFDGCVVLNQIEFLERIESGIYRVGSGFRFNRLGVLCSNEGFTGLEFAGGIPGTVGGATYMNAGANGQEIADVIDSIEIITTEGKFQTLKRTDLDFGYRSSPFQEMDDLAAIVAVTFRLKHSESARKRLQEYMERRRISQPVGERSAGSVFRNPSNMEVSAAELIERAGLKGHRVGGAMVSNIHANFFINIGGSTSQDMLQLIGSVKEIVHEKFGVKLKEEVLYVHPYCQGLNPYKDKRPVM
uniref:UDP-N-acetylmuramate dehydrogenase n=1 Tax=Davidia involucrata TaxID=16924 RepID=A0A5B7BTU1_DAVIN